MAKLHPEDDLIFSCWNSNVSRQGVQLLLPLLMFIICFGQQADWI